MTLPPIPENRNWSPETWHAGLDEVVRRDTSTSFETWEQYQGLYVEALQNAVIAHATTLLDAGIVKPVVSEAQEALRGAWRAWDDTNISCIFECPAAIAVIQSALDKARAEG
jgi:hypothetical protein